MKKLRAFGEFSLPYSLESFVKIKIYKPIILVVVLHGCGIWSPTSMEEHTLRVSENDAEKNYLDIRWMK
jgi:hypothetical protein